MNLDKFKLKNYTTEIPADKSIFEVEQMLASFGASAVMKQFLQDGKCYSMSFKLEDKGFKLPANAKGVYEVMYANMKERHGKNTMKNRDEQAYRVSWRIIRDWLHSQLSLIASGQAQPDEIMMPYTYDGKQTLYEAYKNGRLQLEAKKDE